MKKTIALLCTLLLLTGCSAKNSQAKKDIVTLPLTDEAAAYADAIRETDGTSWALEENYPAILASLESREVQVFPEVEVLNELNCVKYGDNEVYTLGSDDHENIVLYIHGGAYVYEIDPMHVTFCDKLVDRLDAKVYIPIYPLAPQATYAEAYDLLIAVYTDLQSTGKSITIMGDSAGGGFALAFVEYLKANFISTPDRMVLLSPWVDVTLSNPDIAEYEKKDLTLGVYAPTEFGKLWAGDLDTKDPLVSPIYGDLSDLPPSLIFCGTDEIMVPDNEKLYYALREAGNDSTLVFGEGLWHVFPLSNIPESSDALDMIEDFCNNK